MVLLKSQQLIPVWSHLRWWLLYFLITLMMNYLTFGRLNFAALMTLFVLFVVCFYLLDWAVSCFRMGVHSIFILVLLLMALFFFMSLVVYAVVYFFLPWQGVYLYKGSEPFQWRYFIGNMYRNFSPLLVGVVAHRMFIKNENKNRELLHFEQEKSAYLEQKLQMQHENRNLKQSLLVGQLGSHLKHNVTQMIRQRMSRDPDLLELVEGLLDIEQYNYLHMDPDSHGVLLENELSYVRQLISLNRSLDPQAVPVDFRVYRPVVARVIPPFIFSTILENAYKYGDQYDADHPIRLVLESTRDRLVLLATNKMGSNRGVVPSGTAGSSASTGIGLLNVRRQLELLHPGSFDFEAGQQGRMYRVRLVIYFNKLTNKESLTNESREE